MAVSGEADETRNGRSHVFIKALAHDKTKVQSSSKQHPRQLPKAGKTTEPQARASAQEKWEINSLVVISATPRCCCNAPSSAKLASLYSTIEETTHRSPCLRRLVAILTVSTLLSRRRHISSANINNVSRLLGAGTCRSSNGVFEVATA
ncbi:hypothetical protein N657DRAFT_502100 [Parathielavia appendiculata]|uniref:Uncharacterized protein n=1 Tax=Parathielavia appendiculata TaxID=2587402 RepID=A0AAN6TXB9_9PEZI|nr:hypothetical protein N657DRAFT_502100 [Parathielavia appendiculata]